MKTRSRLPRFAFDLSRPLSVVQLPNSGGMALPVLAACDFIELEFVHNASPSLQAKMQQRLLDLRVREWTAPAG